MGRLAVLAGFCIIAISLSAAQDLEKGYEYATKASQGVCWYEYLKILPDKNKKSDKFGTCYLNLSMKRAIESFEKAGVKRDNFRAIKPNMAANMNKFVKSYTPIKYQECDEYLKDPEKDYSKDYSTVLGDGSGSYPYRGWAHCLVGKLEETRGQTAVTALKEKWSSSQPWINEVLNRENENRKRHGSGPLKLNQELSAKAQEWADMLVKKCGKLTVADHINKDHPDGMYQGKQVGENIAQSGTAFPPEDSALVAADGWYEEIRDYPWPAYKGDGKDPQFLKIGHFTASMWKGVEQVGYGLGRRDGCDKTYVVGRYWPAGNVIGQFAANVFPPQA